MKVAKPFGKSRAPGTLRLRLCDTNPDVVDAWLEAFHDVDAVEVLEGSLLDADADALVSPANSFGDMGGGVDKHIDDFYKGAAQPALVAAIRDQFLGELPVGMALIVPMVGAPRFPFFVAAPTMRVPRNVSGTINAYLSLRAALVAVLRHNRHDDARRIWRLAVPGLCTGVGGMSYGEAARQMRVASDNVVGGGWEAVMHPAMAPYAFGPAGHKGWFDPTALPHAIRRTDTGSGNKLDEKTN